MSPVDLGDPAVAAYLERLRTVSGPLPEGRRAELVADIRGHLTQALVGVTAGDTAAVRGVLDRLGTPEDLVAAAAGDGTAVQAARREGDWRLLEVAAVLFVALGFLALRAAGPAVGLVLVWVSRRWTVREKSVATAWTASPFVISYVASKLLWGQGRTFGAMDDTVSVSLAGFVLFGPVVAAGYLAWRIGRRR